MQTISDTHAFPLGTWLEAILDVSGISHRKNNPKEWLGCNDLLKISWGINEEHQIISTRATTAWECKEFRVGDLRHTSWAKKPAANGCMQGLSPFSTLLLPTWHMCWALMVTGLEGKFISGFELVEISSQNWAADGRARWECRKCVDLPVRETAGVMHCTHICEKIPCGRGRKENSVNSVVIFMCLSQNGLSLLQRTCNNYLWAQS